MVHIHHARCTGHCDFASGGGGSLNSAKALPLLGELVDDIFDPLSIESLLQFRRPRIVR